MNLLIIYFIVIGLIVYTFISNRKNYTMKIAIGLINGLQNFLNYFVERDKCNSFMLVSHHPGLFKHIRRSVDRGQEWLDCIASRDIIIKGQYTKKTIVGAVMRDMIIEREKGLQINIFYGTNKYNCDLKKTLYPWTYKFRQHIPIPQPEHS